MEKKATFGAGCFWGVEAAFRQLDGVTKTEVGYEGGTLENPTYEDVCSHTTGHAEVVQVTYDPERISYDELLQVFWGKHDPTQLNRQGWDVGDQYRSVIFTHDAEQEEAAARSKAEEQTRHAQPVVTQIEPAGTFYVAEDYHQQYLEKRGRSSCTPGSPLRLPAERATRALRRLTTDQLGKSNPPTIALHGWATAYTQKSWPLARYERRPERAGRVHRRPGNRPAKQSVQSDDASDSNGRSCAHGARVGSDGHDYEHEQCRQQSLDRNVWPAPTLGTVAPRCAGFAPSCVQNARCGGRPDKLSGDVRQRVPQREVAGHGESNGHRWVHMRTG